jgi:lantibiotic modifying enzyme
MYSPLERITNLLLINALFLPDLGLNGKSSCALFFYKLYEKTKKETYLMIADKLIDHIYKSINRNISSDFLTGISGIGWCIDYLVKNKFLESDSDDLLDEFDNQLFQLDCIKFRHKHNFDELYWPGLYFSIRQDNLVLKNRVLPIIVEDVETILNMSDIRECHFSSDFMLSFIFTVNLLKNHLYEKINYMDCTISGLLKNADIQIFDLAILKNINDADTFPLINTVIPDEVKMGNNDIRYLISKTIIRNLLWQNSDTENYIRSLQIPLAEEVVKYFEMPVYQFGILGLSSCGMALIL